MERKKQQHSILWGLILLGLGSFLFLFGARFAHFLFWVSAVLFFLQGCRRLYVRWFRHQMGQNERSSAIFLHLLMALFFVNNALIPTGLLALFVTIEFVTIGVVLLIDYILQKYNQIHPHWSVLIDGLVHLMGGMWILLHLEMSLDLIYAAMGISLIWRGGLYLIDVHLHAGENGLLNRQKERRRRLGLPIFLSAILPISVLRSVNRFLSPERSQPLFLEGDTKEGSKPDLEIWIHTARRGFEMMGHVDVSYKGVTYAYGQYDVDRQFLFGMIGSGILYRLPSKAYLESLAKEEWRAVVGYGMVLNQEQQAAVEKRLNELMKNTVPFELTSSSQKESYLGYLHREYGAESFSFMKSKFKTYFVMTTNCVLLADTILESIGTDNVANHGILTPGIYQDYFEREYQRPGSSVVTKFILGKQVVKADDDR